MISNTISDRRRGRYALDCNLRPGTVEGWGGLASSSVCEGCSLGLVVCLASISSFALGNKNGGVRDTHAEQKNPCKCKQIHFLATHHVNDIMRLLAGKSRLGDIIEYVSGGDARFDGGRGGER